MNITEIKKEINNFIKEYNLQPNIVLLTEQSIEDLYPLQLVDKSKICGLKIILTDLKEGVGLSKKLYNNYTQEKLDEAYVIGAIEAQKFLDNNNIIDIQGII